MGWEASREGSRLKPRIARLQGMLVEEALLNEQAGLAEQRLSAMVFPAANAPSSVAARLQTDVRQVLIANGLSVSNSQVLPVREGDVFDRVAVKFTAKGSLAALDSALRGLAGSGPRLLVENLDAFPQTNARDRDGQERQELTAVLQIMVLRESS